MPPVQGTSANSCRAAGKNNEGCLLLLLLLILSMEVLGVSSTVQTFRLFTQTHVPPHLSLGRRLPWNLCQSCVSGEHWRSLEHCRSPRERCLVFLDPWLAPTPDKVLILT